MSSEPIMGEIMIFSGNREIEGWFLCDGRTLSVNEHQALFSIIGTTYGGNGIYTFCIPDLRGRVVVGTGANQKLSPRMIGQTGGSEKVGLNVNTLPVHDHAVSSKEMKFNAEPHQHMMGHSHSMTHVHNIPDHDHQMPHSHDLSHTHTYDHNHKVNADSNISGTPKGDPGFSYPGNAPLQVYSDTYSGSPMGQDMISKSSGPTSAPTPLDTGSSSVPKTGIASLGNTGQSDKTNTGDSSITETEKETVKITVSGSLKTESTGMGMEHENMPPFLVLNFYISHSGSYPNFAY